MANLSNINNKFLVTTGGNVLIGQTGAIGSSYTSSQWCLIVLDLI